MLRDRSNTLDVQRSNVTLPLSVIDIRIYKRYSCHHALPSYTSFLLQTGRSCSGGYSSTYLSCVSTGGTYIHIGYVYLVVNILAHVIFDCMHVLILSRHRCCSSTLPGTIYDGTDSVMLGYSLRHGYLWCIATRLLGCYTIVNRWLPPSTLRSCHGNDTSLRSLNIYIYALD